MILWSLRSAGPPRVSCVVCVLACCDCGNSYRLPLCIVPSWCPHDVTGLCGVALPCVVSDMCRSAPGVAAVCHEAAVRRVVPGVLVSESFRSCSLGSLLSLIRCAVAHGMFFQGSKWLRGPGTLVCLSPRCGHLRRCRACAVASGSPGLQRPWAESSPVATSSRQSLSRRGSDPSV